VVLSVDQVFWTHGVESALREMQNRADGASQSESDSGGSALQRYLGTLNEQLSGLVRLVRGRLTPLQRTTLSALTTVDVHARDVVSSLLAAGVDKLDAFEWFAQLRYYWQADANWAGSDGEGVGFAGKGRLEDADGSGPPTGAAAGSGTAAVRGKGGKKLAANSAAAQLASMGLGMVR
jgi:dynein heavy chain